MSRLPLVRLSLLTLAVSVGGSLAWAATPWKTLIPFKRVEADENARYEVTESSGPWMIMATTFRGKESEAQARELVMELRKRYKLPAYAHKKRFDYSKGAQGRGLDRYGNTKKMRYVENAEVDEVAVLVGDYQSVDDSEAQAVLAKIKVAQPESLQTEKGKGNSQSFAALRKAMQQTLPDGHERKKNGPMRHAFVTTNPLLPAEYFSTKGIDKFVLDMNKGVKHSLLACKGRYSVKVATFTGKVVIDQKEIQKLEKANRIDSIDETESKLHEAALKAAKLTAALREKGYEAYEFHDEYSSIVTVGSFDSTGTPRADGKIEINPQAHKIIKTFAAKEGTAKSKQTPGLATNALKQEMVAGIALDIQPVMVEVPRRSISSDYHQSVYR